MSLLFRKLKLNLFTTMKKVLLGFLAFLAFHLAVYAQSSLLTEQVQQSDLIVEGKIIAQSSFWNPDRTLIYTKNTVEVYKVFKGNVSSENIDIVSIGGKVGDKMMTTASLMPQQGEIGLFLVKQKQKQNEMLTQGFVLYDVLQKKAFSATGFLFESVENDLYGVLKQQTGHSFQTKKSTSFFLEPKPRKSNARTESIEIESFVPATVTGGTRTKLTINGSGFGEQRGRNGNVYFSNAETGGSTLKPLIEDFGWNVNESELISWSDTKIEVYVPAFAGTGTIAVINDEKAEARTIAPLTVNYSVLTTPTGWLFPPRPNRTPAANANLVNKNNKGGYTIFTSPTLFEDRNDLTVFSNALSTWRCNTGVNIELAEYQSDIDFGFRGVSSLIITGDYLGTLLSEVYFYYDNCDIGSGENWRLDEFQIVMNLNALKKQNIDIETQFLHLLGRVSQLGYVNVPSDLMYYKLNPGEKKTISDRNKQVTAFVLNQSSTPKDCGPQPMQAVGADACRNTIQAPIARFSADQTALCDKGEITFKDESRNAVTVQWTFTGGTPATSTEKNPIVTYSNAGTYDVTMVATNPMGTHTETKRGYIIVGKSGELQLNLKDTVVCQGTVVKLDAGNAGAGVSYLWSNGATTQTIEVRNANTYTVVVTKNGCSVKGSARVTFANTPADAGANIFVCEGETAKLNATGGIAYKWSPAEGLSNVNIPNPVVTATKTRVYYVEIHTGGACGIIKDSLLVTVTPRPKLFLADTTIFCGVGRGFPLVADSISWNGGQQEGVTYQWNTGETTPNIFINREGKYWITATGRGGCVVRDTTVVKFVKEITATITPSKATICEGESIELKASGGQVYVWKPAEGLSNPNIRNPIASPKSTTTYTVSVSSGGFDACPPAIAEVTITVLPKPALNLGEEITTCDTVVVLDTKIANAKYLWSDGSIDKNLRVRKSGTYKVQVTTETCKDVLIDSVKVNFVSLNLGKYTVSCNKEVVLDTKIPNAKYLWSDGSTGQTLKVTKSGKYKVSVTLQDCNKTLTDSTIVYLPELNIGNGRDSMRSCKPEVVLDALNGLPAAGVPEVEFLWSDGSKNQILKVNKEGWYKITMNRKDCKLTLRDSIYVSFFRVDLGKDIVTCEKEIVLNAGNPGAKYLWNDDLKSTTRTLKVTQSGIYSVTVTDTCGAVGRDTIRVTFNRLKANITQDTILACQTPYILDAGNRGIAASYLWNDGSKTQTLSIDKDGLYTVTMEDFCKNQLVNRVYVTFAKPTLAFPDTIHSCQDSVILDSKIKQGTATFTWSDGSTLPKLKVTKAGKYWLSVRTACGEVLSDTVQVFFYKAPKVDWTYQISSSQGGSVVFTNNTIGEASDEYLWDFGDGKTSTQKNPTHIFQEVGIFKVSLTVKSKYCGTVPKVEKNVNITVASANDNPYASRVNVYPNPSENGNFTLKHTLGNGAFAVKITDLMGKTWSLSEIQGAEYQLDLSVLPKGVYLLEMQNGQYRVVKKLVIH
ncbi:PKD domain-containing protein [Thermoflexibacter ruber]|nr:PKD domain-containing protein [Thermoflexibacter ruber]